MIKLTKQMELEQQKTTEQKAQDQISCIAAEVRKCLYLLKARHQPLSEPIVCFSRTNIIEL